MSVERKYGLDSCRGINSLYWNPISGRWKSINHRCCNLVGGDDD